MNGMEGIGSAEILRSFSNQAGGESRRQAGMEGSLALSRKFLSSALAETGFIDIQSGSIANIERFVQQCTSEPEETTAEIDPCMAAELTGYVGGEIQGEVNLVLRLLARVDPERVGRLLR